MIKIITALLLTLVMRFILLRLTYVISTSVSLLWKVWNANQESKSQEIGDYYVFNNIRYAEAPVNENRFQPPREITNVDLNVNNGSVGFKCPQAIPKWALGQLLDNPDVSVIDVPENEDCLFLDVVVPRNVFHSAKGMLESHHCLLSVFS